MIRVKLVKTSLQDFLLRNLNRPKTPVFVLGCWRSGTTMFMRVIDRSPQCCVYHEGDRRAMELPRYRLRTADTIQRLIRNSRRQVVVFKPLNDSQHADRLLEFHPNAKVIWVYRRYQDVVNSAVKKWHSVWKDMMCGIAEGYCKRRGQDDVSERMSPETVSLVRRLSSENMTLEEGAALLWYVRNLLYFEHLQNNQGVLLVKYEDLVTKPEQYFLRVFDFLGCYFSHEYIGSVSDTSIGKFDFPTINSEIEFLCKSMTNQLDDQYKMQVSQWPTNKAKQSTFDPKLNLKA